MKVLATPVRASLSLPNLIDAINRMLIHNPLPYGKWVRIEDAIALETAAKRIREELAKIKK